MSVVTTDHVLQMLRRILRRSTKLAECERELATLTELPFYEQDRTQHLVYSAGEGRVLAHFVCFKDAKEWAAKQPSYLHVSVYVKAP